MNAIVTPEPQPIEIPGVNVMLQGGSGTGKTYCIETLVKAGIETFVLFTEPGQETLGHVQSKLLHWHYVASTNSSFATLIASATDINTKTQDALSKLTDPNKTKYREFIQILQALENFTDDRTGHKYGAVDSWGPDRAIVVDGLSGLSIAAMNLAVGGKPIPSPADWGMAQGQIERLIQKLTMGCKCHFVLISHVEREVDEITGATKTMASALGKKLAPKLPRYFSDVIMTKRQGATFTWTTADSSAELKSRNLPIADGQAPDFGPIIKKWKQNAGVA